VQFEDPRYIQWLLSPKGIEDDDAREQVKAYLDQVESLWKNWEGFFFIWDNAGLSHGNRLAILIPAQMVPNSPGRASMRMCRWRNIDSSIVEHALKAYGSLPPMMDRSRAPSVWSSFLQKIQNQLRRVDGGFFSIFWCGLPLKESQCFFLSCFF